MATTTIDQLDELTLSIIFKYLSNQDIWYSGILCPQLRLSRQQEARFRQELGLLIGKDAKRYIDESGFTIHERWLPLDENGNVNCRRRGDLMFHENYIQLQIYSFPLDFVRLLLSNFDNLTKLTISTRLNVNELVPIIHLLEQFSPRNGQTLHTLKLYSNDDPNLELNDNQNHQIRNAQNRYDRLLTAVNSIGSLRKLTFDVAKTKFSNSADTNSKVPQIELPILAQLEEFEFNSADEFVCLPDSITRYAVNNQALRHIAIHNSVTDFNWLLELPTELASRFSHIRLRIYESNCRIYLTDYNYFRAHPQGPIWMLRFVNLISLECDFELGPHYTIIQLLRPLASLPRLVSLVVNIDVSKLKYETRHGGFGLPSVKVLTINITTAGRNARHNFMQEFDFDFLFHNVQVVRVIRQYSLCASCEKKVPELLSATRVSRLEEHCARYMFSKFANSQSLRMVSSEVVGDSQVAGPRYREWVWNEMPPFKSEAQVLARMCRLQRPRFPVYNYCPIRIRDDDDSLKGSDDEDSDYELDELRRNELEELNQELFGDSVEVDN